MAAAICLPGVGAAAFRASGESLRRNFGVSGTLARPDRCDAPSRSRREDVGNAPVVVRAQAREFCRRLIRVQVNPRDNELATIRSVPVQVARELLNAGHRYLDVRTMEEFSTGHVEGAVNVPYLKTAGRGMTKNLHFVEDVSRVFHKDDELIVGCQSGKRSLMAAAELQAAEFSGVTDMVGGHQAWVNGGLPTRVNV